MKILKFGGSSVGDVNRIKQVIRIIDCYYSKQEKVSVVFSAFEKVTDTLILLSNLAEKKDDSYSLIHKELWKRHKNIADGLIPKSKSKDIHKYIDDLFEELKDILHGLFLVGEKTPRTLDYIMSFGERLSCYIITSALKNKKINCEYLDSRKLIKTDYCYGSAKVNFDVTYKNIKKHFKQNELMQIITGFIASNYDDKTSTLGRGGSDYTASIYGAALKVEEIVIYTDVDGILTADPRKVKSAFSLKAVTYEEAMELSHFGAKVIHPPTILPALRSKVKIRIKNTFNPEFNGTVILEREAGIKFNIKGISSISEITMLTIRGGGMVGVAGIASRLMSALARRDISIILITQGSSEHSISIAVMPEHGPAAKLAVEEEFSYEIKDGKVDSVNTDENLSVIACVGESMKQTPGVFGKIFHALGRNGVNVTAVTQGSSDLNVSIVLKRDYLTKALNVLHDSLFLSKLKTLNLFMIGPGLVGGTLLNLMNRRIQYLREELGLRVKMIGLANSKSMTFNLHGLKLSDWHKELDTSEEKMNVKKFIQRMKEYNLSNTIFVDSTASNLVIPYYKEILSNSISIVTPNKIANTGKYEDYKVIHETAKKYNVKFKYGTNVGAALPIINTLKDLISNGDKIYKIEGVLSGTLSYIFNSLRENGNTFSGIVKQAKEMGFTEPDPRDDLNGLDMVRKLLILVREIGIEMELNDIDVENLIPDPLRKVKSVETFLKKLEAYDKEFIERKEKAAERGKILCYIAKYENGKAKVGVEEIGSDHPFFNLSGNDNIVAFTTKNYKEKPLMVRGAGAGADVTASGVFTDILRISNYLSV